jgi:hypothetical protein
VTYWARCSVTVLQKTLSAHAERDRYIPPGVAVEIGHHGGVRVKGKVAGEVHEYKRAIHDGLTGTQRGPGEHSPHSY